LHGEGLAFVVQPERTDRSVPESRAPHTVRAASRSLFRHARS
jgi:hypothetical protein